VGAVGSSRGKSLSIRAHHILPSSKQRARKDAKQSKGARQGRWIVSARRGQGRAMGAKAEAKQGKTIVFLRKKRCTPDESPAPLVKV
jgi:hypothetical protein